MLRPRAVRALLVEEVAGLRTGGVAGDESSNDEAAATSLPDGEAGTGAADRETIERERTTLARAARRALFFVVLDLVAVAVLFAFRPAVAFLTLGPSEEAVFTVGVLAVTLHAGYRLAQYRRLHTLARLHAELVEREG